MESAQFRYQNLAYPDSIRLLLLHPANVHSADLDCSLLYTTISECDYDLIEPYTALSYVWGDAARIGRVLIDGTVVGITATLDAALRDLRDATRVRRVWVDALCINQSNIPERNHQVTLMGQIYSTAQHTVIHLGTLTKETEEIFQNASPRSSHRLQSEDRNRVVKLAQQHLLSRLWFRRVWVFQELILSKDPWVQCGGMRVRWTDLCDLLVPAGMPQGSKLEGLTEGLQILNNMAMQRRGSQAGTLFSLLMSRRGLGATDPRDFVYAHFGLAADIGRVNQYLKVDYSKPIGYIFGRTARYMFDTVGVERAMSHIDSLPPSERRQGLPSWAPDWSYSRSYAVSMYKDNMLTQLRLTGNYCAFTDNPLPQVMGHVGYEVDVIEETSLSLPESSRIGPQLVAEYQSATSELESLYQSGGGPYTSGDRYGRYTHINLRGKEAQHEALCRLVTGIWLRFLQQIRLSAASEASVHDRFVSSFEGWLDEESKRQRIFVGHNAQGIVWLIYLYMLSKGAETVLDRRRLARTKMGRHAVVPAQAETGDIVVYLAGSNTALLIRRNEGKEDDSLDRALRASIMDADIRVKATAEGGLLWSASQEDHVQIMHCIVLGECYVDGVVGWSLSKPPQKVDIKVFAVH